MLVCRKNSGANPHEADCDQAIAANVTLVEGVNWLRPVCHGASADQDLGVSSVRGSDHAQVGSAVSIAQWPGNVEAVLWIDG